MIKKNLQIAIFKKEKKHKNLGTKFVGLNVEFNQIVRKIFQIIPLSITETLFLFNYEIFFRPISLPFLLFEVSSGTHFYNFIVLIDFHCNEGKNECQCS